MDHFFDCPNCGGHIHVLKNQVNCGIFRHGIYKIGHRQLPPHSPKELCDKVFKEGLIWGCGLPFKFDGKIATKCDYI